MDCYPGNIGASTVQNTYVRFPLAKNDAPAKGNREILADGFSNGTSRSYQEIVKRLKSANGFQPSLLRSNHAIYFRVARR